MPLETLLLFLPACFALNLAFGPNNLLSLTNAARQGVGFAVLAASGRLIAFAPMIAISAAGLGLLLATSAVVFNIVKLLGAAYLIYLGIRLLLSASSARLGAGATLSLGNAFRQECLVALGNPKAILIFTAFFPQFVAPDNYWQSFAILGALFLVLELIAIALYACLGRFVAKAAAQRLVWLTRASGFAMIVFGSLLALSRREA